MKSSTRAKCSAPTIKAHTHTQRKTTTELGKQAPHLVQASKILLAYPADASLHLPNQATKPEKRADPSFSKLVLPTETNITA